MGREEENPRTLFLCGDVMTGRGIDQILPDPVDPALHEPHVRDARQYVELAELANGNVPAPVDPAYVWGEALEELDRVGPAFRIINLETSVTRSETPDPKGINYRMSPENASCLEAARIDACAVANNHILDWGVPGLLETLETLDTAGIATAGAGPDRQHAWEPAVLGGPSRRVLVFGFGARTSGIPPGWAATETDPGVAFLPDLSEDTLRSVARRIAEARRPEDVVIASIHWGGNWGFAVPKDQRRFAHALVDEGGVDVVHGHSSHHVKGIEVYRERLILYGCGDFLNDYEGISGREEFRADLTLMYFPTLGPDGRLRKLRMTPMRIERLRLNRASDADTDWLTRTLDREGASFGTRVERADDGTLRLRWK